MRISWLCSLLTSHNSRQQGHAKRCCRATAGRVGVQHVLSSGEASRDGQEQCQCHVRLVLRRRTHDQGVRLCDDDKSVTVASLCTFSSGLCAQHWLLQQEHRTMINLAASSVVAVHGGGVFV